LLRDQIEAYQIL